MGAIVEINTDGLAKLGETICYSLGLTAFGRKKMANAESYAAIKQAETNSGKPGAKSISLRFNCELWSSRILIFV